MSFIRMRQNLDANLLQLQRQLLDGTFQFGRYNFFEIVDQKRRTICAASSQERVVFQAMMRICHPVFEQYQTNDSFASRPNRGTYKALERAQQYAARYRWFAKLDVCKFFYSISHEVMFHQLCRLFKDPLLLQHFYSIIRSYEASPGRGLPIGNLTSQYFANHYMAVADHWAKEQLHVPAMIRYMDDVLLFNNSHQALMQHVKAYTNYVATELKLQLHEPVVNTTHRGIPFLGYVDYADCLRLSRRSKRRFRKKMQQLSRLYHEGYITDREYGMRAECLVAFLDHADSMGYRASLAQRNKGIYS